MKINNQKTTLMIRLPKKDKRTVKKIAAINGYTLSSYMRGIISGIIKAYEDKL